MVSPRFSEPFSSLQNSPASRDLTSEMGGSNPVEIREALSVSVHLCSLPIYLEFNCYAIENASGYNLPSSNGSLPPAQKPLRILISLRTLNHSSISLRTREGQASFDGLSRGRPAARLDCATGEAQEDTFKKAIDEPASCR